LSNPQRFALHGHFINRDQQGATSSKSKSEEQIIKLPDEFAAVQEKIQSNLSTPSFLGITKSMSYVVYP
jgi:hypothetical protein